MSQVKSTRKGMVIILNKEFWWWTKNGCRYVVNLCDFVKVLRVELSQCCEIISLLDIRRYWMPAVVLTWFVHLPGSYFVGTSSFFISQHEPVIVKLHSLHLLWTYQHAWLYFYCVFVQVYVNIFFRFKAVYP